ncbi:putative ABC transport system ATP-binding protein [Curtobacterium sp. AG1037]|uniref:ABC transporter ATP-binding protein n=1 Tax=Curtobacterium sp. AG1037 TaxID=2183990 RepID=UPI000E09E427|nr:ATP-binding cassette domain-containing protein [Curtobacterium sp. AG1037]RDH96855.1 putative ABC transport system ATP-binding protein [Curtobacterium sp. AG1037]
MVNARPVLDARGLGFDVGSRTLWEEMTVSVPEGGSVAVRGASGQGKSTLLRCLGGLQRPDRGRVQVSGVDVHRCSARERRVLRRDVVGFVVQDHAVVPQWTVEQNLRVVRLPGVARVDLERRILGALAVVGLHGRGRMRAGLLSGGEQQRVAVARVLVQQPRLVLADEPTASLDRASAARVCEGLEVLRSAGTAVVVATHDPELIAWAGAALDLGDGVRA